MLGLQVQRSDTPIYSHIERCTYVDCYHKICYLHRPWPFGHVVGRVWAMMLFTSGNKTGRRKLQGQSGDSSCTKAAASKFKSWVHFSPSFSLCLPHRCPHSSSSSPAFLNMWSHHRFVTFVNLTDLENNKWLLVSILLVFAGCNSNSMWKLCLFQWKCCYLQRATEHNVEPWF